MVASVVEQSVASCSRMNNGYRQVFGEQAREVVVA